MAAPVTTRIPGFTLTDHRVDVPLDHADPDGPTIEVFAREVVAAGREREQLPWLLFLQGGPGGMSPRPGAGPGDGWLAHATRTHRVLLLDQRGTGRSTPLSRRTIGGPGLVSDAELAAYVRLMRADSIVRDAEVLRAQVAGGSRWETLGQSYGGWITMSYLSLAPEALDACYVTGGLPGLSARADDVYARTYPRVAAKNAAHHARFPGDAVLLRRIADHLDAVDVRLPDGDRLTTRRLRMLGQLLGMGDGSLRLHWLLERAWETQGGADGLSDAFLHGVAVETAHVEGPLFLLQEYLYGQPGSGPTAWAAERAMAEHPEFALDRDPLLLTGEMAYRWMFTDIAALRPFLGAADLLAAYDDWGPLYDLDRLAANEVPVLAAVYHDDMYVDAGLSLDTASRVGSVRTWVTNEFEHDGLRVGAPAVLGRLMDMRAGRV
ncbi:alpha/beta fold hydrolase [Nocardioides flavescens]|uniref:Alpha/beta fold hydrolase n=1 Tax=Nocardioides flavescens TaxID=2691959 RepID=A0A6L7F4L6_9ACTN|nr:alpha/beta fold hydrolase [Nocardioides flavescens]MXG92163.1 alpha/beta fold hydrolase [Nocardioides flavescens]